jgi:alkylhydroperoxidase/carboxymuconolactone decarboxylase family protein YurZ
MDRTLAAHKETLRRLTLNDEGYVAQVLGGRATPVAGAFLDARTEDLLRLAALIAMDAGPSAMDTAVAAAMAAGASPGDIVDVLLLVAPSVGSARLVGVAPRIAEALGYDVHAALERLDPDPNG